MDTSSHTLRSFGLMMAAFLTGIFGLLLPFLSHKHIPLWPWAVSAVFLGLGVLAPNVLSGFYRVWMRLGSILGWVNTRIILSIIFYLLITPIGLLMRLCGYDALDSKWAPSQSSYFHKVDARDTNHMEKPF